MAAPVAASRRRSYSVSAFPDGIHSPRFRTHSANRDIPLVKACAITSLLRGVQAAGAVPRLTYLMGGNGDPIRTSRVRSERAPGPEPEALSPCWIALVVVEAQRVECESHVCEDGIP